MGRQMGGWVDGFILSLSLNSTAFEHSRGICFPRSHPKFRTDHIFLIENILDIQLKKTTHEYHLPASGSKLSPVSSVSKPQKEGVNTATSPRPGAQNVWLSAAGPYIPHTWAVRL